MSTPVQATGSTAEDQTRADEGSRRVLVVALAANLGIAAAKFVAAAVTGSPALLADAFHSLAESGSERPLGVARARGPRPPGAARPPRRGRGGSRGAAR